MYRVFSEKGALLIERGFRLEPRIRAEAPGPNGMLEGQLVPIAEPTFSVPIPLY